MAQKQSTIKIRFIGDDKQVRESLNEIRTDAKRAGEAFNIESFADELNASRSSVEGLANAAKDMPGAFEKASRESSEFKLEGVEESARNIGENIESAAKEAKHFDSTLEGVESEFDDIEDKSKSALSSVKTFAGGLLAASGIQMGVDAIGEGFKSVITQGAEFKDSLADLEAITGVAGGALDKMGESARDLAKEFGGAPTQQIQAFKGVLSRLGPGIGDSPEALENMTHSINTLSQASGLEASQSMNALTNSMLQFDVSLDDPIAASEKMAEMMNTLAAGAKEGAAEIPKIAEAVVIAGSTAKQANISFEETNAAIQVLAKKAGLYGAEAGTKMRNVIGLLQKNSSQAEKLTASLGLPFEKLGKTLNEQGLEAAMGSLREAMQKLETPAQRNAAVMQIFGRENASAAQALLYNTNQLGEFTRKLTGTNTAVEQSAVKQATLASQWERVSAQISDKALDAFDKLEPAISDALDVLSEGIEPATDALEFLIDLLEDLAPVLATAGAAYGAYKLALMAGTRGTKIAASATRKLNAAIKANPAGAVVAGVTALAAATRGLADAIGESTEERLEGIEAEEKLLERQKDQNRERQEELENVEELVNEYERLGSKKKLDSDESERLKLITRKLNEEYPGVIKSTYDFSKNLARVQKAGKSAKDELGNLIDKMGELEDKERKLLKERLRTDAILAQEDIVDILVDANANIADRGLEWITSLFLGADRSWSEARMYARNWMDQFAAGISEAENLEQLQTAAGKFEDAINKSFSDNATVRQNLIQQLDKYVAAQEKVVASTKGSVNELQGQNSAAASLFDTLKIKLDEFSQSASDYDKAELDQKFKALGNELANAQDKLKPEEYKRLRSILDGIRAAFKDAGDKAAAAAQKAKAEWKEAAEAFNQFWAESLKQLGEIGAEIIGSETEAAIRSLEQQKEALMANTALLDSERLSEVLEIDKQLLEKENDLALDKIKEQYDARIQQAEDAADDLLEIENLTAKQIADINAITNEKIAALNQAKNQQIELQNKKHVAEVRETEREASEDIADAKTDEYEKNQKARINAIEDLNRREYELAVYYAEKEYADRLNKAEGNNALELQAFIDLQNAKLQAEQQYLLAASSIGEQAAVNLANNIRESFASGVSFTDEAAKQQAKQALERIDRQEQELRDSYARREIDRAEYLSRLNELDRERTKQQREIANSQFDIWRGLNESLRDAFKTTHDYLVELFQKQYEEFGRIANAQLQTEKDIQENRQDAFAARISNNLSEEKQLNDEHEDLLGKREKLDQEYTEIVQDLYTQQAAIVGAQMGQALAEGENALKAFVLNTLKAAKAMVPIWVVQILGKEFATKSFPGIASAAILTGLLQTALSKAESAVANLAFASGGDLPGLSVGETGLQQGGKKVIGVTINEHGSEYIHNAATTAANAKDFDRLNREKMNIKDYVAKYYGDEMFGDIAAKQDLRLKTVETAVSGLTNRLTRLENIRYKHQPKLNVSVNIDTSGMERRLDKITEALNSKPSRKEVFEHKNYTFTAELDSKTISKKVSERETRRRRHR